MATGYWLPEYVDVNVTNNYNVTAERVNVNCIKTEEVVVNGPVVVLNANPYTFRQQRNRNENVYDDALRDPPPPEDLSHLFTQEELDHEPDEKLFIKLAKAFDSRSKWRWLARKLKTDQPTLHKILMFTPESDVQEIVYQILVAWKRVNRVVKIQELVTSLCESRNGRHVPVLKEYFEKEKEQAKEKEKEKENEKEMEK